VDDDYNFTSKNLMGIIRAVSFDAFDGDSTRMATPLVIGQEIEKLVDLIDEQHGKSISRDRVHQNIIGILYGVLRRVHHYGFKHGQNYAVNQIRTLIEGGKT
jgi:hypothetical protein